jgi:hypothetical protein
MIENRLEEQAMSEDTSICAQPQTAHNEKIRVRRFPKLRLGIFQRVMNWCGRNQLATALFVIMLIVIILQQLLLTGLFVEQRRMQDRMRSRTLEDIRQIKRAL